MTLQVTAKPAFEETILLVLCAVSVPFTIPWLFGRNHRAFPQRRLYWRAWTLVWLALFCWHRICRRAWRMAGKHWMTQHFHKYFVLRFLWIVLRSCTFHMTKFVAISRVLKDSNLPTHFTKFSMVSDPMRFRQNYRHFELVGTLSPHPLHIGKWKTLSLSQHVFNHWRRSRLWVSRIYDILRALDMFISNCGPHKLWALKTIVFK